jgi:6-phosphogluconate dehydrogenase
MQLGMVGLGRMGGNIVRRLTRNGHQCVVFDRNPAAIAALVKEGAGASIGLESLVGQLEKPRVVWVMLPAGDITERTVAQLGELMERGDIIIDGGNSFYKDDIRRAQALKPKGIRYVDCGTSGGVWGLDRGYCMMIGGDKDVVDHLDPIFDALAPGPGSIPVTPGRQGRDPRVARGYMRCGPSGAGRFAKMIHNGIEYGLMQAYAEGFNILRGAASEALPADQRFHIDLPDVAEVWRRGSVIGSWLLDLTAIALSEDPELAGYSGFVDDSGEGRWTIMAAIEEAVPADVLSAALYARFRSREKESFSDKLLSAMRHQFGGHLEPKVEPKIEPKAT